MTTTATLDLFLANGNPDDLIEDVTNGQVTYREPLMLFHNNGQRHFKM